MAELCDFQDTSSTISGMINISTDSSAKTEESETERTEEQFIRPATVANRDALDLEDTMTILVAPESKEGPVLGSCTALLEEDSRGSSLSQKLAKHTEISTAGEGALEEDSRSSFDSFKTPASRELTSSEVPPEEDSQSSFASQRSAKQRWDAVDERSSVFPAENLFEYQWPATKMGEYYMLQEQVSEFLAVKSFKRKHPDLTRRQCDMDEKQFLKDRGVVTETQCDLGLTALRSDEVMDLMMRDYPEKYAEYDRVLQEKEKQNISEKHKLYAADTAYALGSKELRTNTVETKLDITKCSEKDEKLTETSSALDLCRASVVTDIKDKPNVEKSKMADFVKKAMRATAEWNMHFNRERKEERRASFDLQTMTIHYPVGKKLKLEKEATEVGLYPVALIPGQYQDHYRKFTANELKYYPLNTVLYGPRTNVCHETGSDGSQSDSEESSSSDGSSSGSSQGTQDGSGDSSSAESQGRIPDAKDTSLTQERKTYSRVSKASTETKTTSQSKSDTKVTRSRGKDTICKVCKTKLPKDSQEGVVICSECRCSGHSSCLNLSKDLVSVIKTYPWQCTDCKTCTHCLDPYDEDKMMICDNCDRGYHTFCVGLKDLPSGQWICALCEECSLCKAKYPGSPHSKIQWNQQLRKLLSGSKDSGKALCAQCYRSQYPT